MTPSAYAASVMRLFRKSNLQCDLEVACLHPSEILIDKITYSVSREGSKTMGCVDRWARLWGPRLPVICLLEYSRAPTEDSDPIFYKLS